jgi:hypothetical protein
MVAPMRIMVVKDLDVKIELLQARVEDVGTLKDEYVHNVPLP